ncbi:MAG: hypothetical protein KAH03_02125, partial [Cocleimonas sp.]|nr:hypothetical protein [Cocleimonas sp.]
MIYLMWQLWLCLFVALLSGALLGWLSRGGCKKKVSAIDDHWSQRFELIEEERDLFAIKAQDSARLTNENNSLLGRLSSMESGANLASDVLNENKSRLDKADLKLSKMTLLLEQRDSDLIVLQDLLSDANHIDEKTERKSLVGDFNNADEGLRIELKSKNEELEGLTNDYQEAKESTGTMRAQLEDYEKVNRELLEKEGEIEQALSVAKKLNIANKEKNAETQSQLEITDQKNHELSKDLDRLSEKLAIADEKSADDVQRIEKITDLYDQNIENSRTFKSQIMQSGNDLRTDLKNQKELCESLEQEIQSVKEEAKVNADKVISVQDLLKVKEKKNDEIVAVEQQLQMDLSTAESLSAKNEEKIAEYQKEKERLADKLHVSKEKELVSENELKVMQGLLVAHEKGSQDLLDKESKLEEELVALKAKEIENKDILSKFESELKKLNNELNFNKEKILIDAGEQKIMQGLLAAHEKGNQESQSKESQLEEELSVLKTREIKSKDVISRFESKLEKLNKALN